MPKGVKSDTVRIEVSEVLRLTRMATTSRVAVVRAAQEYRRAIEILRSCRDGARARTLDPTRQCGEEEKAFESALDRLLAAALAVALDDE